MVDVVRPPIEMVTEEVMSMSAEVGLVTMSVSVEPLGVGNGVAHAEISTADEALELARAVARHTTLIDPKASTGCGDEREVVSTSTGEPTPKGSRLFGGPTNAASGALIIGGRVRPGTNFSNVYSETGKTLREAGEREDVHVDTFTEMEVPGGDSHCGSLDGDKKVHGAVHDAAEALLPFNQFMTSKLGVIFNEPAYFEGAGRSRAYIDAGGFEGWDGMQAVQQAIENGGIVRKMDAGSYDDPTHGHHGSLLVPVLRPGIRIDVEGLQAETGKTVFVVTLPKLAELADIYVAETNPVVAQEEKARFIQDGVQFQLAHAMVVPDGSQYLCTIG